jgi:hypothetical protein
MEFGQNRRQERSKEPQPLQTLPQVQEDPYEVDAHQLVGRQL